MGAVDFVLEAKFFRISEAGVDGSCPEALEDKSLDLCCSFG